MAEQETAEQNETSSRSDTKEKDAKQTNRGAKRSGVKTRWHFPNANECPRCKTHDTIATSTKGNKQYRVCRRGHCRYRYCVTGVKELTAKRVKKS